MSAWRRTRALTRVAGVLVGSPADRRYERHYIRPLSQSSGVRPGTLLPMLDRMIREGWLHYGLDQAGNGYYETTERGRAALRALLERP